MRLTRLIACSALLAVSFASGRSLETTINLPDSPPHVALRLVAVKSGIRLQS